MKKLIAYSSLSGQLSKFNLVESALSQCSVMYAECAVSELLVGRGVVRRPVFLPTLSYLASQQRL